MKTSVFDLFKIGIGPSSSHTVGPMRAAREFVVSLREQGLLDAVTRVKSELYGALALTGLGHGTDRAILLGLSGELPEKVEPAQIESHLDHIRNGKSICLLGSRSVPFDESTDLLFHRELVLPGHPNGMRFSAFDSISCLLSSSVFYSVGGGFIVEEGRRNPEQATTLDVPHPFSSASELLAQAQDRGLPIWQIMLENESSLHGEAAVRQRLSHLWSVMDASIERGLCTEGILPGGLNVRRRAPRLYRKLCEHSKPDPFRAMDQVNIFAMAVNEENAAGGRVVTAPTNGASGLLPAVGRYYREFMPDGSDEGLLRYLLTAGAIGILYKENASISGAEVGCQGEVGVACSRPRVA